MLQPHDLNAAAAKIADTLNPLREALDARGYSKPEISLYLTRPHFSASPFMLIIYPVGEGTGRLRYCETFTPDRYSDVFQQAQSWIAALPFNVEWTPALIERTLGVGSDPYEPALVAAE